jgi:hypothetical protein
MRRKPLAVIKPPLVSIVFNRFCYVAKTCGGDDALRRQVELLLDSHERAKSFLETPAAPPSGATALTRNLEGTRIGPYQLGPRICTTSAIRTASTIW